MLRLLPSCFSYSTAFRAESIHGGEFKFARQTDIPSTIFESEPAFARLIQLAKAGLADVFTNCNGQLVEACFAGSLTKPHGQLVKSVPPAKVHIVTDS